VSLVSAIGMQSNPGWAASGVVASGWVKDSAKGELDDSALKIYKELSRN